MHKYLEIYFYIANLKCTPGWEPLL